MTVTVYTKPACVQCNQTKWLLKREGIPFTEAALTPEALDLAASLDIVQAPFVTHEVNGELVDAWGGFRDDKIKGLVGEGRG